MTERELMQLERDARKKDYGAKYYKPDVLLGLIEEVKEMQGIITAIRAELELARRVADAAVGWQLAHTLKLRFIMASSKPEPDEIADAAYRVMVGVAFEANNALADAIAEYRARVAAD